MSNYLKSEFYKLVHRAYPFVILILCSITAIIINYAVWYSQEVIRIPFAIEGEDMLMAGLYMMASVIWYMIIFTTDIGFSGEWRNNTMKNTVSFGTNRNTIFFGKCIMNFLILLIGILIVSDIYVLSNYLFFHNDGSLTTAVYGEFFLRFALMLPLIFAGQMMASSLCMFFSTDLLWCGIYAVVIALLPNGIYLISELFPEMREIRILYEYLPTTCLTRLAFSQNELTSELINQSMLVALVVVAVPTVVSLIVFNKKEIK